MENSLEPIQKKEIITTLIKDHLINTKFINGLNDLGWYSQDYHLHFSDVIWNIAKRATHQLPIILAAKCTDCALSRTW